jgi:hypothetical protein
MEDKTTSEAYKYLVARASGYSLFCCRGRCEKAAVVCTRGNGGIVKPSCGVNEAGFETRKTRHKIKYAKHADAKNNEVRQDKRTPLSGQKHYWIPRLRLVNPKVCVMHRRQSQRAQGICVADRSCHNRVHSGSLCVGSSDVRGLD